MPHARYEFDTSEMKVATSKTKPSRKGRLVNFPRVKPWDSFAILAGLTRGDISLADSELCKHEDLIRFDMYTEFDSYNLDSHISTMGSKGIVFSSDFLLFRMAWKQDEWNHYLGYRRLLHMITGKEEALLHRETIERTSNFEPMNHLLSDEFAICLVLAYDEMITRRSCSMDIPLFKSFGHPSFLSWIKLVGRDEGWHFKNALTVIKRNHADRIQEVPAALEKLLEWDLAQKPYEATFVLDHDPDRFDEASLRTYMESIPKYLGK